MRVLHLTSSYPKCRGDGTAPFIERIVLEVARRGHEVDVVLPRHPELVIRDRTGNLPVRFFPFTAGPARPHVWGYASSMEADRRVRGAALLVAPFATASALRELRRRVGSTSYDLVHAHWVLPNGPVAALAAAKSGIPLVVSLHGSDVFLAERSRWLGRLARWVCDRSGAVTACSRDLAERVERLAPGVRCAVIPYGVSLEDISSGDASEWRRRAGAGAADFLVVGLGRLVAKKGFGHLLRAVATLREEGSPIRVALGGDGDLAKALATLAKQAGIDPRVKFLGRVPHDEVGGVLRAADAIVVPSVRDELGNVDGLPNVLLEALAAGRPVIASRIAGIPDVVEDDHNGLLVPAGDADGLAAALRRLVADPGLRQRLAREAQRSARSLTWEAHGQRLIEIYETLVRKSDEG